MSDYKFSLPVYRIDEDGDLTYLFRYNTNFLPEQNDLIVNLLQDDNGNPIRRLYFRIKERIYPTICGDKNIVNHTEDEQVILQVILELDEPV